MTDRDKRIEAALAALGKTTPGPWEVIYGTGDDYSEVIANFNRLFVADIETKDDATLIVAAPDLAAEVVRLRKWQSEAVQYLDDALEYLRNQISVWEVYNRHKVYQSALDDINRLIAEAEGE